eukprot:7384422-Prymnesium_polylepis.1
MICSPSPGDELLSLGRLLERPLCGVAAASWWSPIANPHRGARGRHAGAATLCVTSRCHYFYYSTPCELDGEKCGRFAKFNWPQSVDSTLSAR